MKTLYLNHSGFFKFCKGYGESKTIKFPFNKRRRASEMQKFCYCISEPRVYIRRSASIFCGFLTETVHLLALLFRFAHKTAQKVLLSSKYSLLTPCTPAVFFKDKEIIGFAWSGGRTEASGVCALHTRSLPK